MYSLYKRNTNMSLVCQFQGFAMNRSDERPKHID